MELDHLLWAVPDLEGAGRHLRDATGVTPMVGGSHPGFGTRNQLVGLGAGLYLEIIGPDPDQPLDGTLGGEFASMPEPRMLTVAFRTSDLAGVAEAARSAGGAPGDPIAMNRTRPDGVRLDWSIMRFDDPDRGAGMPFMIDWQGSPHPSETAPGGCTLESLTMLDPEPAGLSDVLNAIGASLDVARGLYRGAVVRLSTPNGPVVLT